MTTIDPTARIEDGAVIGAGTSIGPYCIIGSHVVIGADCKLLAHVSVTGHTTIGAGCVVYPFAALGGPPQDLSYRGEPTRLEIGEGCCLREGVTMNVGTKKGGGITRVGARGYFMNNSHVGHDCLVGSDVAVLSRHRQRWAAIAGFGDFVYIGGLSAVHRFHRIGPQVMVGGICGVRGNVIPFGLVNGQYASLEGFNIVGGATARHGSPRSGRSIKSCFMAPGIFAERLKEVQPLATEARAIRKSWPSSATASFVLCAFRLATATEIDDGITGAMTSKALEISSPVA